MYGATATGKTHTLIGTSANDDNDPQNNAGHEGLVSRLASQLFDSIQRADTAIEFTVRCSVVEVYLERIRDLLDESNCVQLDHRGKLMGCSRLSCLSGQDLAAIVGRANAVRTCSSADPNRDSSRSSLLIQVDIEQYDRRSDTNRVSSLLLCDLMGSELASTTGEDNTEPAMVSRSLKALHRQVQEQKDGVPITAAESTPALAQLVSTSIGGNSYTSFFLAASPSNYAVRETTNTILFGLDCRKISNKPVENTVERWQNYSARAQEVEEQQRLSESLARALGSECKRLQSVSGTRLKRSIEVIVDKMLECESDNRPLRFTVETKSDHQIRTEQMRLKSDSRRAQTERKTAVSEQEQLRSDLTILQSQNASLKEQLSKVQEELAVSKNENVSLHQLRQEVEHSLRTSQFRENEAIVFLRQIRRFYYRLLKKMVAEASGDFEQVVLQIPGAPDLTQLADIDQSMFESGLLEEDEIGRDVSVNCRPSSDALTRSTSATQKMIEAAKHDNVTYESPTNASSVVDGFPSFPKFVVEREEKPEAIEARQRLYSTPSGRYIAMREKMLEEELLTLSERCIQLQNKLEDEKANVEALTERGGMAGAFDRMRAASEAKALKDLLDKKDNDIKVLIWKMNELHMMSKTLKTESANKDRHISYLAENFEKLQNKHKLLAEEEMQREKKLREDIKTLQTQIESVTIPVWHLSEHSVSQIPSHCRMVAPFSSRKESIQDPERRSSTGEIGEWVKMDLLHYLSGDSDQLGVNLDSEAEKSTVGRDGPVKVDVEVQTDPIEFDLPIKLKKSAEIDVVHNCLFMDDSSEDETTPNGFEEPGKTELTSHNLKQLRDLSSHAHSAVSGSATRVEMSVRESCSFPPGARSQTTTMNSVGGLPNSAIPARAFSSLGPQNSRKRKPANIPDQGVDSCSPDTEYQDESPTTVQSESTEEKPQRDHGKCCSLEPGPQNESAEEKKEFPLSVSRPEIISQNSKQSWRVRLSETNHSGSSFAGRFAHSSSTSKQPHSLSLPQFMNKKNTENNANGSDNDDEKTTTPEFLKLFKKIGNRNQGESVIEASGCAPAKAPPRTAYGEFLRQDSKQRIKEVDSSTILKPWTPKKKKDDDDSSSDDDSIAQAFASGSGVPIGQGPAYQADSSDSSDGDAKEIDDSSDSSEMTPPNSNYSSTSEDAGVHVSVSAPMESRQKDDSDDSDSSEEDEATPTPERGPKLTPRKVDSDSDDSSDSSVEATRTYLSKPAPSKNDSDSVSSDAEEGASASVQKPRLPKDDSESDDSSDSSKEATSNLASKLAPPKVDSYSHIGDEDETVSAPVPNSAPALTPKPANSKYDSGSDSESSSEEEEEARRAVPQAANLKGDSDSDSESSSEENGEALTSTSNPTTSKDDYDSESESSSDEEEVAPTPDPKTPSSKGDSDSESESSSEEKEVEPTPDPKTLSSKGDSDSESESSSEEKEVEPTPDPKTLSSKGDSDSESESSSEEEEVVPTPDPKVSSSKGDSDSESKSLSQEAPMPAPESAISKCDSDSDSESSSEEEQESTLTSKPAPFRDNSHASDDGDARPAPLTVSTEDDSDSDSDDSVEDARPPFPHKRDDLKLSGSRSSYKHANIAGESRTDVSDSTWGEPSESLNFSTHSEVSPYFEEEGRPVNFTPKRKVEDYGSNVKPAVTTMSNSDASDKAGKNKYAKKGGKLAKESARSKGKTQFALKRGKLVKTDDRSRSSRESSNERSAGARVVISEGKLVKVDKKLKSEKSGSKSDDHFNVVDPVEMQSELMRSVSDEDWGQDASPRKSKRTSANFVIKNGKLVKEAQEQSSKKASFQVVNGKLVKSGEGGTMSLVKKSPKKLASTGSIPGKSDSGKQRSSKKVSERGSTKKKPSDGTHTKKKPSDNTTRRKPRTRAQR
jgi:hypothetical protein